MFDYLMSKMTWIIAAVILTSSILGIFAWQRETMERVELEDITLDVAGIIDETNDVEGETRLRVTFQEDKEAAFHLPSTLNGREYTIDLTRDGLYVSQDGEKDWCDLKGDIHLFDPHFLDNKTCIADLNRLDQVFDHRTIHSGEDFMMEKKLVGDGYRLFLSPYAQESSLEEDTENVYSKISKIVDPSLCSETTFNSSQQLPSNATIKFSTNSFYLSGYRKRAPKTLDLVHLWNPDKKDDDHQFDREELDALDRDNRSITIKAGENYTVRRQMITVGGNETLSSFIYES